MGPAKKGQFVRRSPHDTLRVLFLPLGYTNLDALSPIISLLQSDTPVLNPFFASQWIATMVGKANEYQFYFFFSMQLTHAHPSFLISVLYDSIIIPIHIVRLARPPACCPHMCVTQVEKRQKNLSYRFDRRSLFPTFFFILVSKAREPTRCLLKN